MLQEITGVQVPGRRHTAPTQVTIDEPLRNFNRDKLQNLRPAFAGRTGQQSGLPCTSLGLAAVHAPILCSWMLLPDCRSALQTTLFRSKGQGKCPPGCTADLGGCACLEGPLVVQDVRGSTSWSLTAQRSACICRQASCLHSEACCLCPQSSPL